VTCPTCGAAMIPLFTSFVCSAECDRRPPVRNEAQRWRAAMSKVPSHQRSRVEQECGQRTGTAFYLWRLHGVWIVRGGMAPAEKYDAEVIVKMGDDGAVRVLKNKFGGLDMSSIPDA
jgi:hypothetical protein